MSNQEDFLSNTTSDRAVYVKSWRQHISQLEGLALPLMDSDLDLYKELGDIKERLNNLVFIAAETEFQP